MTEPHPDWQTLADDIRQWAVSLGFQQTGITDVDLTAYEPRFLEWLGKQYHGEMNYMASHGEKRYRPAELIPGTLRVISLRMDYLPPETECMRVLNTPQQGYVSRYALGRDYHKLMRKRLAHLSRQILGVTGGAGG